MAQNAVTILMQTGLDKAVDAGAFPNFAIKYFLPIYDSRTDELIHSAVGTSGAQAPYAAIPNEQSLSTSADAGPVLPSQIEGQLLWALDSAYEYKFDDTSDYQYSTTSGQSSTALVSTLETKNTKANIIQRKSDDIIFGLQENIMNTYKGSDVSGQNGSFNSSVAFVESTALETVSTWDKTKLYNGVTYKGIAEGDTDGVGVYSVEIQNKIPGDFKFNKVLVFIQKLNANGTEDASNPVPFALLTLSSTAVRTESINASVAGINSFEAFFKLKFAATADAQMFVQDDQIWSLAPGSSAYGNDLAASINKDIYVLPTSGSNYDATPLAKLHVIAEPGKPIMRGGRSKFVDHKGFLLDLQDEHLLLYNEESLNSSSTILTSADITDPTQVYRSLLRTTKVTGNISDSIILSNNSETSAVSASVIIGSSTSATAFENSTLNGYNTSALEVNSSTIHGYDNNISNTELSTINAKRLTVPLSTNSIISIDNNQGSDYTLTSQYSVITGDIQFDAASTNSTSVKNSFASVNGSLQKFQFIDESLLIGKFSGTNPINIARSSVITDTVTGNNINVDLGFNYTRYLDIVGTNNAINNSSNLTTFDRYITLRGSDNNITGTHITVFGTDNDIAKSNGDPAVSNIRSIFINGDDNNVFGITSNSTILGALNTITDSLTSTLLGNLNIIKNSSSVNISGSSNLNEGVDESTLIGQSNTHQFITSTNFVKSVYSLGDNNSVSNVNTINNTSIIHEHLYNIGDDNNILLDASTASSAQYDNIYNIGTGNISTNGNNTINIGIGNILTGAVGDDTHYNNQNIGFGNTILNSDESNNIGHYSEINNSSSITSVGKNNTTNDANNVSIFGNNNTVSGDHSSNGSTNIVGNYVIFAEGTQPEPNEFSSYSNKTVFGGANNTAASTNFVDSIAFWVGQRDSKSRMVINTDNFETVIFGAVPSTAREGEIYLQQVAAAGLQSNEYRLTIYKAP